ncbi:MAG: hypothetical protein KDC18_15010 [Alphaproteobacteria bacterium]|nr:hypothetical protein [Alphaproteobacteria bacterium]MCB9931704.1 hypothetical protein [Alphaproteobacteria bacterium]
MRIVIALIAGGIFGLGLTLSDMVNPARVLGFLDVAGGAWDPTLAFVLGGAVLPMAVAWRLTPGRRPLFGPAFPGAPSTVLDLRLVGGSALFGLGWGLVGLCPGPALAVLPLDGWPVWLFAAAMIAGMALANMVANAAANRRG